MFKVPINRLVSNISPYLNFIIFLVLDDFAVCTFGLCRELLADWTNRIATWTHLMTCMPCHAMWEDNIHLDFNLIDIILF